MRAHTAIAAALATATLTQAPVASAEEPTTLSVDPAVDIPLTLAPLTLFAVIYLGKVAERPVTVETLPDRPEGLDAFSPFELRSAPALVSDALLYGSLAAGLAVTTLDGRLDGQAGAAALIYTQAFAINGAVTELTKAAISRPRPYTYDTGAHETEDVASFFSGHTSFTATAAFATAHMLDMTGDLSRPQRAVAYGGATLLTMGVGAARVLAGKHYVSDVLVGGVVGGAIGWLVPQMHSGSPVDLGASAGPDGETVLVVSGRF